MSINHSILAYKFLESISKKLNSEDISHLESCRNLSSNYKVTVLLFFDEMLLILKMIFDFFLVHIEAKDSLDLSFYSIVMIVLV